MTIQQLEARTGLPRGSIRYYEKEGLIAPRRRANGYRDYSEDDALTVEKIAFLRRLELPLETIRAVQTGELPLSLALDRQEKVLLCHQRETLQALELTRALRADGTSYAALRPSDYQGRLPPPSQPGTLPAPQSPAHSAAGHPVRRLLARVLDESILCLPAWTVLALTAGMHPMLRVLLLKLALGVCGIVLEALCLSQLGTTPGKALMGLHLRYALWEGTARPGFLQALERAVMVWVLGRGLGIRLSALVCGALAWRRANRGEEQPWDDAWEYTADEHARPAAVALLLAGIFAVSALEGGLSDRLSQPAQEEAPVTFSAEQLTEAVNLILSGHPQMEPWRDISLDRLGVWSSDSRELSPWQLTMEQQEGVLTFVTLTGPDNETTVALANALYLAARELMEPGLGFQSDPFTVSEGTGQSYSEFGGWVSAGTGQSYGDFGGWSFFFQRLEDHAVALLKPPGG